MNLRTFIHAKKFTKLLIIVQFFLIDAAWADWKLDLSRRRKDVRQQELKAPVKKSGPEGFFDKLFTADAQASDIVVLNTKEGFVPDTLRLMKGMKYRVHVVNVNSSEMNVSFILDAFSEHHATYYGKIKTFNVEPRKEGVYSFQCPETSIEGRLVVYQSESTPPRFPASH